jgi:lysophospholipase L1-like esterase
MKIHHLAFALVGLIASAALAQPKYLAMGDSITAGSGVPNPATQTYPAILASMAAAAGAPVTLWNVGTSGAKTTDGRRTMALYMNPVPKVVTIMYGANDHQWFAGSDGWPADYKRHNVDIGFYKANLSTIVEVCRSLGARPILITPPMWRSDAQDAPGYSLNEAMSAWAEAVRQVAREHPDALGRSVPLVDVNLDWQTRACGSATSAQSMSCCSINCTPTPRVIT